MQFLRRLETIISKSRPSFVFRHASNWTERLKKNYNIVLMGSPGCGKTSTGSLLAERLQKPVIDIDNDYLEPLWGMTVGHKLATVGNENFIEEEGSALLQFNPSPGCIVSLTGSNPLHDQAMRHVANNGLVIFIDVMSTDIVQRLHKMKVDRLVYHGEAKSIEEVLLYRRGFYERAYDVRILCEELEPVESVVCKIEQEINRLKNPALFESTRNKETKIQGLNKVVLKGLADDGGLFVPVASFPTLSLGEWNRLVKLPFQERALRILEKWLHPGDVHPQVLRTFVHKSYNDFLASEVAPVAKLHKNQFLVEMFHGPTASFKDAALQLMPHFFAHAASQEEANTRYLILVATSGDTGSAALDGFRKSGNSDVKVMVLYPERGISSVQKALMTCVNSNNVKVFGVDGDFDACQSTVKSIFNNKSLADHLLNNFSLKLSAANSINWGRLLPQVVYHASAYLDLVNQGVISIGDECDVCVPTGNFGNLLAAFYAKEMGIPFRRFICASNVNNVLHDFFHSGVYDLRKRDLKVSSSPAMDILKSSNLERFLHLVTRGNAYLVKSWFESLGRNGVFAVEKKILNEISEDYNLISDWCSEEQCMANIKKVFQETGYLLDPHTSVAKVVADRYQCHDRPILICGTAHYAKFPEDVLTALGINVHERDLPRMLQQLKAVGPRPDMHSVLEASLTEPRVHNTVIKPSSDEVTKEIIAFCESEK